ncbi:hypothetical protein DSECCO2_370530 [anaerobic digester metagenome]
MVPELLLIAAVMPEQVADVVFGSRSAPTRCPEFRGENPEVADRVRVVPGPLEVDRTDTAVEEVIAGRGVAVDHAAGVGADPRAAPPRPEQAVEPLPQRFREAGLVEHRVEVGEIARPVAGGPRTVVEPPEQMRDAGQGFIEGDPRRVEIPYRQTRDVLGDEDRVKPAVCCERARDTDPSGCAPEPVELVLHRRVRVVACLRTRRRAEELADHAECGAGELVPADNMRCGLYPVDPDAAAPLLHPVAEDACEPVPERIADLKASYRSLDAHSPPSTSPA